jgi:uncharacterized protein (TIGR00266 family)
MDIEILYQPSYSIARVTLKPNEGVRAEAGAMVSMTAGIQVETSLRGGFLKSLTRSMLGGESFFTNTFRSATGGEMMFAPTLPGDIAVLQVEPQTPYLVQSGSFLASEEAVETDATWSGAKTFFGGEGLFMLRCTGQGKVIVSSYGAIHALTLESGETYTVDTGHLVAFENQMGFSVRAIGSMKTTLLGGEGLVVDLTGPGKVFIQTRSERAFLDWLIPKLPTKSSD